MTRTNDASEDAARAIRELGLASKLVPLSPEGAQHLYEAIEQRFASSTRVRWLWEHLRNPGVSRELDGDEAFERLGEIVPDVNEQLLYVPGIPSMGTRRMRSSYRYWKNTSIASRFTATSGNKCS